MKSKFLIAGLMIALFSLTFASAHAGEDDYSHHSMMGNWMMGDYSGIWGWNIFGWLFGILVIVALVLLIIWLVKQIQKK